MALPSNGPLVITLLAPQTAGGGQTFDASPYREVWVLAIGLASAETCSVSAVSPDTQTFPIPGRAGLVAGAPGLTATIQADVFPGGNNLRIQKSVTAGAVGIYVIPISARF